jgi:hypothetical protein
MNVLLFHLMPYADLDRKAIPDRLVDPAQSFL